MPKVSKLLIVLFIAAAVVSIAGICRCEDSAQDLKVFRGQVEEIDWVGNLLTVMGADEMTFYVPPGTKIRYGTDTISLDDVEQEDYVLVRYIDDPTGTPRAVSISLNKTYPDF